MVRVSRKCLREGIHFRSILNSPVAYLNSTLGLQHQSDTVRRSISLAITPGGKLHSQVIFESSLDG